MTEEDDGEKHPLSEEDNDGRKACSKVCFYLRPILAEMIGTMLFVFIGVVAKATEGFLGIALAQGCTASALMIGFGWISGGHFNPAITLGKFVSGGLRFALFIWYPVAQIIGAILGAQCASMILDYKSGSSKIPVSDVIKAGIQEMDHNVRPGQAVSAEILLTLLLVLIVLLVTDEDNPTTLGSLAVGLVITGGILACGKVSGGTMNPVHAFGPAVVGSYRTKITGVVWKNHHVYWLGSLIGGALAGILYKLMFANGRDRCVGKDL